MIACYETANISSRSATRDTSNTTRDFDLDNTRQTVNTRDSILDFSKEEDDDDASMCLERNNDNSILFGELHEFPPPMESQAKAAASIHSNTHSATTSASNKRSIMDGLTLYSVTDSLVDSLCNSTVCMPSAPSNVNGGTTAGGATTSTTDKFSQLHPSICTSASSVGCGNWQAVPEGSTPRTSVSVDVWQLLGCAASPADAELEDIWSLRTSDMIRQSTNKQPPPARASIKRRLKRIHGLRMERVSGASRHGMTIANGNGRRNLRTSNHVPLLEKAYSTLDDPLASFIGQGIDPIPMDDDENVGYDSDPEINSSFRSPSHQASALYPQSASMEKHEVMQTEPLPFDETEMKFSVQVSFGC